MEIYFEGLWKDLIIILKYYPVEFSAIEKRIRYPVSMNNL